MDAKAIAETYAGKVVRCLTLKSSPLTKGTYIDTPAGKVYEGRVLGYRYADKTKTPTFVIVEVINGVTSNKVRSLFAMPEYVATVKMLPLAYGKRLYPEELIFAGDLPVSKNFNSKEIPPFPHKCLACGHPALNMLMMIDCSNPKCIHKYKSKSALDLFATGF